MWAQLLRMLLMGGGTGTAARGAGGAARGGGWRAMLGFKPAQTAAPQPVGTYARGAKQQNVNYIRSLMNSQQNIQQHHVQPQPQGPQGQGPQDGWIKSAGKLVASTLGITDAFNGVKKLLKGDFTGAVKSFGTSIAKVATSVVTLPIAINRWSEALVESRREMAKYSGQAMVAFSKLDVGQVRRDMQFSRGTSGSTSRLVDATNEFRDAFQPIREDMATITNAVSLVAVNIGTGLSNVYSTLRKFVPLIGPFLNWLERGEKSDQQLPILEYMKAYRDYANNPNNKPLPGW